MCFSRVEQRPLTELVIGLLIVILLGPVILGYATGLLNTIKAVPDYFATCFPSWSFIEWYERDKLFVPVDALKEYIVQGCPDEERKTISKPVFISSPVFQFVERTLDWGYYLGYDAAREHMTRTAFPAWNWAFKNHPSLTWASVLVLALTAVGFFAMLTVRVSQHLLSRSARMMRRYRKH